MGQQQQRDIFSDPHAGTPLRGQRPQPEDDPRFSDPHAGEPLRINASKIAEHPHARTARIVGNVLGAAWEAANPYELAKGFGRMVIPEAAARAMGAGDEEASHYGPINTVINPMRATFEAAREAFNRGDYGSAAIKAVFSGVPMAGPALAQMGDEMGTDPQRAIGHAIGFGATMAAPAAVSHVVRVPVRGPLKATTNPEEAAAVQFARENNIPLDAGTVTGSQFVRNVQKKVGSSWGGASTVESAKAAQGEALAAAGQRLAERANNGPAIGPVEAGESVRGALQTRVKDFHAQANRAYTRLREAEASAPEELVQARPPKPVAAHVTPEQSFVLRWLAKDLEDNQFQPGGTTLGTRRRAYESIDPVERDALMRNPRVAGTPTQETFHALGISGSRAEIATKIDRFLTGQSKDSRFAALADAYNQAWDGRHFDFDLVADDTLAALGVRRRDLKHPMGLPDFNEAGAAAFYPDEAIPQAPTATAAGDTAMRLAVDLRPRKEALRQLFDELQKEREITGTLMGDKARAAVALEGFLNGPDYAPLSAVNAALSPLRKLAGGASMRQLRTPGQGLAARVVAELDTAVRERAQAAGGDVAQSLAEGRAATRAKYNSADAMKLLAPTNREPRAIFSRLTANKDAGIAKLRELQKQAPDQLPVVARALLEDILDKPTSEGGFKYADKAWADWQKVGPESKRILFADPGHVKALDHFFLLAKRIGENPNPSGTAQVMNATNLLAGVPMYALAKMLYSPKAVRLLTRATEISVSARPAAQAAALGQLSRAAQEAGVILDLPKAAETTPDQQRPRRRP